ncbi:WD40-repeat-containing domain protein [Chaetomium sp. MPI-CAGE-AT-0009]|nr:WD40-repeat-containing domain protein [Chaetomium sp. MPI-CAGE-AT-0009]
MAEPSQLPSSPLAPLDDASVLRRRLKNFSFARKRAAATKQEDIWGPLGLRLLHSPPEPLIDFIFVHGLRGGSVKTWCGSEDLQLFWPQAWLPRDPDLQNARIHSFGYNSDWGDSKETSLDLHDFGKSLLGEMSTSPTLNNGGQVPIILIGHSMGGLVIKKAYLLAQQDERTRSLAGRIRSMFFLATPHHGSDFANPLNNLLRATTILTPRQYVADIARNSAAIAAINNEFQIFADDLHIWSFYETVKTRVGINSALIVEKDSAVIGHKNEIVNPTNADHRNICKFDSPTNPNYLFLRNSLVKAVEYVLRNALERRANETNLHISILETLLHIEHSAAEDDLSVIEAKKTDGTCLWVTDLPSFRAWRDADDEIFVCHWLTGQAGAGKSVLTAHVARHLQSLGVDTCFYFFRHGQEAQQTVSDLLRSLAFQMALIHPSIRQTLLASQKAGLRFDKDDEQAIWRNIFLNGILQIPIPTTQYWIIDGLDECVDPAKMFLLLQKFDSNFYIRIFFSSRRLPDLEDSVGRLPHRVYRHHINVEETKADIKRFVENNSENLPVDSERRPALTERLVRMSDGAFIWATLAFRELQRAFDEEEIDEILDKVPAGMAFLYDRILESMAKNKRQVKLMRAVLAWCVCSTRPLSTAELEDILTFDLRSKVLSLERTIHELCGQLLQINNGRVQMIHATAREFLLGEASGSIFAVEKATTNQHLAFVCLKYLTSDEMRPPRNPSLVSKRSRRSLFVDYACTSLSDHLAASPCSSDELLQLMDKFLRGNVLSWVEYIAREKRDLRYIINACKNFQRYQDQHIKDISVLDKRLSHIDEWRNDLWRVILKFGDYLLRDPASIYFILPPQCPTDSRIYQQFGKTATGLRVGGLTNTSWDDCICSISHRHSRALSLASCDGLFAIGLKSGVIKIYQQSTYRETYTMYHGEPVKILRFSNASQLLASGGFRQINMWSATGELLWSISHGESPLLGMSFTAGDKCLVTVSKHSDVITLNVNDGSRNSGDGNEEGYKRHLKLKQGDFVLRADFCPKMELLAVAGRGRPVELWSVWDDVLISTFHLSRDTPGVLPVMSVSQLIFNPNPAIELLAVAYQDGELAIFDTWADKEYEVKSLAADSLTLASTPDGRTLATGDARGVIKLWDFETLTLLYRIKSTEYEVRTLAFSGDGLRLYDIRDTKTKIWEPAVLVRDSSHPQSSAIESTAMPDSVVRDTEHVEIMAIVAPPEARCVFAGKEDGSVVTYDWTTGAMVFTLYAHRRHVFVTNISWNHAVIATSDSSNLVQVHTLIKSPLNVWTSSGKQFEIKRDKMIWELQLHPRDPLLMVRQTLHSTLVDTSTGDEYPVPIDTDDDYRAWLWLCRQPGSSLLLGARSHEVDLYTFDMVDSLESWRMRVWRLTNAGKPLEQAIQRLVADRYEKYIAVVLEVPKRKEQLPVLLVYETNKLREDGAETMAYDPILVVPRQAMRTFLGFCGSGMVYLDEQLWVRVIDLTEVNPNTSFDMVQSERYCFIPQEYIGANNGVDGVVTSMGSLAFPKEGELAVLINVFACPFNG